MFEDVTKIEYVIGDFSNLTHGNDMFSGCRSLISWDGGLASLTHGNGMFDDCTSLDESSISRIIASLPIYEDGEHEIGFKNVSALRATHMKAAIVKGWSLGGAIDGDCLADGTFDTTARSIVRGAACLRDGTAMFENVAEIECVTGNFPNLTNGRFMFSGCRSLSLWDVALPSLADGRGMFLACTSLPSWAVDLASLSDGRYMFLDSLLTSFKGELSSLEDGSGMFCNSSLNSFKGDLSFLKYGNGMFSDTTLISWTVDLPSLIDGKGMFLACTSLSSWDGELASLTNGESMFDDCTSLDESSISHIIASLPIYEDGEHEIGFKNVSALSEIHMKAAVAKGWTVGRA